MHAWLIAIAMASSASSLLRATRSKLIPPSYLSRTFASPPARPSPYRSPAFSSSSAAATAARSSVHRWSHGVLWRSPYSLRPQIRAIAPFIERFHRKIATSGTSPLTPIISELFFFTLFFCPFDLIDSPWNRSFQLLFFLLPFLGQM